MKTQLNQVSEDQAKAILAFREKAGKTWKRSLMDAWMKGSYPGFTVTYRHLLQQVRNQKGPLWLKDLVFVEQIRVRL